MTWWRNAVVYEVYVRSFTDSNGDGIGDLAGVRARLPHLTALGVDAIWLTPFYRSPMADGGYDVADYRDVDPMFGTPADVDALIVDAHARNIRVIVDIVPNHTSAAHPWFRAALTAGPGADERERYIFRPGRGPHGERPPNDWTSVFGGPAWTRLDDGDWYLHLFTPQQPDLNWRDPRVPAEFADVLRFWLDRGVDGFRIDVAMGLYKAADLPDVVTGSPHRSGGPIWSRPEVHDVYRAWRRILNDYGTDRMTVGEVWTDSVTDLVRYLRPDELHQAFTFDWLLADWSATAFAKVIDDTRRAAEPVGASATWVLSNHDVQRPVTRYGGGARGLARARAAALTMLALPGSVYLYQGEELGLPEVTELPTEVLHDPVTERGDRPGRDGCRVPIPWDERPPAYGFAPDGATPWLPMPDAWGELSVRAQRADPDSTLHLYRAALRLRRDVLTDRPFGDLDTVGDVLRFTRGASFTCVLNCGTEPARLPPHEEVLLSSGPLGTVASHPLPPDTAVWLRTG